MEIELNNNDEKMKNAYNEAKTDIVNLLGWFECEMQKQPAKLNWGHVGSLNHIRENLIETLAFMSGFDAKEIKNTLEETKL
ncbi:MAG TPA: hypothetical protein PLE88_12010 [Anaerohalosphaeraceae bacterium]|nr:hypothetical protein [Anaerohalosphaeraceae bacterium]